MKKVLSVVLLLILVLSVTACGNTAGIEDKWVLVSEKGQYSEEFEGSGLLHSNEYKYDETGKKVGETLVYHGEGTYVSENFQYDNNGNVVAKTEKFTSYYLQEDSYTHYTYTYDSDNRLVNEVVMYEISETYSITYNYDEYGNLIEEKSLYKSGNDVYDGNKIYTLKYENNVCVQSEITLEEIENGDKIIDYSLETYQYDDYGNRIEKKYYTAIESAEEAKNPIEINGKLYKHYSTTTYTYAKLKDVAVETTTNSTTTTTAATTTTTTTTTAPIKLSNSCDAVIASGRNNGDFYELVANQTDAIQGSTIEVGVIKNNEWLVPLSKNSPFLDDTGWWKGAYKSTTLEEIREDKVMYVNGGYFLFEAGDEIIYNPENNVSFEICNVYGHYRYDIRNEEESGVTRDLVINGLVLAQAGGKENRLRLTLFDMNTGKATKIGGIFSDKKTNSPNFLYGFSEGVFFAQNLDDFLSEPYSGIFDINGNMLVDLSSYNVLSPKDGKGYYEDGEITLTCVNENRIKFNITFDKQGNVIKQEKLG